MTGAAGLPHLHGPLHINIKNNVPAGLELLLNLIPAGPVKIAVDFGPLKKTGRLAGPVSRNASPG